MADEEWRCGSPATFAALNDKPFWPMTVHLSDFTP